MTLNIHFAPSGFKKPVFQLGLDTQTVKSLFNCCGSMTSPKTYNLNITLSASSHFLYKVTEHKSLYDVDNLKTPPGRDAQFSVKKKEQEWAS